MNRYVYKIAYATIKNKYIYTEDSAKCYTFVSKKMTERKTLKRAIKFIRNLSNNNNTKDSYTYVEMMVLNKKSRKPVYLQRRWGELIDYSDSEIEMALKEILRRYCE